MGRALVFIGNCSPVSMTHQEVRARVSVLNPCSSESCRHSFLPLPPCLSVHINQAASSQPLPTRLTGREHTKVQGVSENEHLLWDNVAVAGCHRSAGRNSSLQIQEEPRAGGEKGGLPGGPLGRGLPAQPVSLLGLDLLRPVLFPPVYLLTWPGVFTCGSKGGADHR